MLELNDLSQSVLYQQKKKYLVPLIQFTNFAVEKTSYNEYNFGSICTLLGGHCKKLR
jgi:hypothetical protein